MDHDPSACQATFVELAFGINALWAVYDKFSYSFTCAFSAKMAGLLAEVQVFEKATDHPENRLASFQQKVANMIGQHQFFQDRALVIGKFLSILGAIACVVVVYFDLTGFLGRKSIFLLFPFFLNTIVPILIFGVIRVIIEWKVWWYKSFVKEYEMAQAAARAEVENKTKDLDS